MGVLSVWVQIGAVENFGSPFIGAKLMVESVLFFISFSFLKVFIFNKNVSNEFNDIRQ